MRLLGKGIPMLMFLAIAPAAMPQVQGARANRPTASASADFKTLAAQAADASQQNHLGDAIALYRKALALKPSWPDGWWSLGTIEYDQSLYPQAANAFAKLVALQPHNGTALAMLGLCQFELKHYEAALKNLMAADNFGVLKDEQLREVAVYHLGLLQLRTKRFMAARETLQQLAKDGVKTRELNTALGEAALLIRPKDAPPEGTEGATVLDRAGQAEILLAQKYFDRAKQAYRSLADEYPTYPNLHIAFGRLLLETHDIDEAVDEFQKELKADPKNVTALLEIAAVRYRLDSQDGLKYAESAVKLAPEQPFAHYLLGLLRLDTDDAAGAIPELEIARKAFPQEASMYFSLGNAYARVGRKADAAKARAEFTRLNAQVTKQPDNSVYGERPLGLSENQLHSKGKEAPRP